MEASRLPAGNRSKRKALAGLVLFISGAQPEPARSVNKEDLWHEKSSNHNLFFDARSAM